MLTTSGTDGFQLAYDRHGSGSRAVLLLHGWPGDRRDYRHVVPLLSDRFDVVVPDLRGFGASDKHRAEPAEQYSAAAQARSIVALIDELGLERPVVAGYDIGSRVAQAIARRSPGLVGALMVSPPLPGIAGRVLAARTQAEFWYQSLHRLPLAQQLMDGHPEAVRTYLRHFWDHWSGPGFTLSESDLDHLVSVYGPPGAFTASIAWYRAGAGAVAVSLAESAPDPGDRIRTPTHVLWPEHDPLFPREWSDRLPEFFGDVTLEEVDGVGHFTPLEAAAQFAAAILRVADRI
ncbi:alpha/beta fold hydrolase [Nakamurella sp. PAMC28650]|uniref:alpha/beta fold hydrolase n=1 Tax=Nakamurella sp. PAMC28650 TaxID=2762325 RepID=UPI00164D9011|nr:alpha/beta hydrolase [Nakamurella sp. PAMC28650]QNK79916.1 alpha/beta hydrolase [Nakamurella sp. PAMC28650]